MANFSHRLVPIRGKLQAVKPAITNMDFLAGHKHQVADSTTTAVAAVVMLHLQETEGMLQVVTQLHSKFCTGFLSQLGKYSYLPPLSQLKLIRLDINL